LVRLGLLLTVLSFEAEARAALSKQDFESVCSKQRDLKVSTPTKSPDGSSVDPKEARYTVVDSGELIVAKQDALTFCFERGDGKCPLSTSRAGLPLATGRPVSAIVRIDRIAPRGKEMVACSSVHSGVVYELAPEVDGTFTEPAV
jgi:hypothetical protein